MLRVLHLYHRPPAGRPIRVAWTLEEVGAEWDLTLLDRESSKSPEHLARQPLGRVPALAFEDGTLFESAAICLQLADLHPESGLAPPLGTRERGLVYQWAVFVPAELEPPLIGASFEFRDDPERRRSALGRFVNGREVVANALGDSEYLVGDRLTIADVLVATTLAWVVAAGRADTLPANLLAYTERLTAREPFQRANARLTPAAPTS